MIHLDRNQYPALKAFSQIVRNDMMTKNIQNIISPSVYLIGQDYGFCNDEINEIVSECYEQLVKLKASR